MPAPKIAGMLSKNEKRAALSRVSPKAKAAVMVVPERDEPGIRATAWARPMSRASLTVIVAVVRLNEARRSTNQSTAARPMSDAAITRRSLVKVPSMASLKVRPMTMMGSDPSRTNQPIRASADCAENDVRRRTFSLRKATVMERISRRK